MIGPFRVSKQNLFPSLLSLRAPLKSCRWERQTFAMRPVFDAHAEGKRVKNMTYSSGRQSKASGRSARLTESRVAQTDSN